MTRKPEANYYLMWENLKNEISGITVEEEMIHLSELEGIMADIEEDWSE